MYVPLVASPWGGYCHSKMPNPTKATNMMKVDRRMGNRRLTGTDMNPTSGLRASASPAA
jgi:hypothetical protein